MPLPERARPVPMARVAILAPEDRTRDLLVQLAAAGCVQLDMPREGGEGSAPEARLGAVADVEGWRREGRADLLAGEAELDRCAAAAVRRCGAALVLGWMPVEAVPEVSGRLAGCGGAVAELPPPRWAEPPTALRGRGVAAPFQPLVETYATVPYRDLDPTAFAAASLTLMFGMMFADAGHGLLLALLGLWLRRTRRRSLVGVRRMWPVAVAAGVAAAVFGVLYGELFGPTGVLPALWLAPLEHPVTLLLAGGAAGAVLLAGSHVIGTVNRWREGGPWLALTAPSGVGGLLLLVGALAAVSGAGGAPAPLRVLGAVALPAGAALVLAGMAARGGRGGVRIAEVAVEFFDAVLHVGANAISFARLAAFGLTHAAIGWAVWEATAALWRRGPAGAVAAAVLFFAGNAAAFALEALVAAVQALRLEYYELFSRIFAGEGSRFRPWRFPVVTGASTAPVGAPAED